MADDRARNDRESEHAIGLLPELAAIGWIVGVEPVGTGREEHGVAVDLGDDRRSIRLLQLGLRIPLPRSLRLPGDLSGGGVEGDDVLLIAPVAVEDQSVFKQHRRAAGAVFVLDLLE